VIQLASIILSHATSESDQTHPVNKNVQLLMDGLIEGELAGKLFGGDTLGGHLVFEGLIGTADSR
jgi:hypothetical protein